MPKSGPGKILTLLGVVAAVAAVLVALRFGSNALREMEMPTETPPPSPAPEMNSLAAEDTNDRVVESEAPAIPPDKVEAWLARHQRDASSLLAAFQVRGDTNYLREAATNFPNDPRVQWTILARNAFPDERREWLDRFKASSPDNSLADYLSAREHFRNGQADAAFRDLLAATGKSTFKQYAAEAQAGGQDLAAEAGLSGESEASSGLSAAVSDLDLAGFRTLGRDLMALQKQYAAAGDTASLANLTQMGIAMAERFVSGEGSKYLIGELTGIGLEEKLLQALDPNVSYDFLGGRTPAQRIRELGQREDEFHALTRAVHPDLLNLSDADWISYSQRLRLYGEVDALRWLQQQRAGATPSNGN